MKCLDGSFSMGLITLPLAMSSTTLSEQVSGLTYITSFWLARLDLTLSLCTTAPEYLLCLQNGNFDKPNRLFHR